jgi:hypothetical protein
MLRPWVIAAVAILIAFVPSASAASPPNDTPATATLMTTLPFDDSVSIADANTEPLDDEIHQLCGADALEHSVWYRYNATSEGIVRMDVSTTDGFEPGAAVSRGFPVNGDSIVMCGEIDTYIETEPGGTYYFAAYSRSVGATGTLNIHAQFRPKTVFLTLDSVARDPATGSVTLTGTITCSSSAEFGFVQARMAAHTGRESGASDQGFSCTGSPEPWTAEVAPRHGQFLGRITVEVFAFICDDFACEEEIAHEVVKLKPH